MKLSDSLAADESEGHDRAWHRSRIHEISWQRHTLQPPRTTNRLLIHIWKGLCSVRSFGIVEMVMKERNERAAINGWAWFAIIPAMLAMTSASIGCGGDGNASLGTLEDLEFAAFVDGDTAGTPTTIRLSDYFAENLSGTRIVMINAAAGWCVPCMREAEALPEFAAAYEPRGVVILVAVFQDQNGDPADQDFTKIWIDTFGLSVPTLIDTAFQTSAYFDANTMPANMFVDAETLDILAIAEGADAGSDPMREYRELLDHYLE